MNLIRAVVTAVASHEGVNIVSFDAQGTPMRMMSFELDARIAPGAAVVLGCKSSHVSLGSHLSGVLSISNRLEGVIEEVVRGQLLCRVRIATAGTVIESIITRDSAEAMHLEPGTAITALVKASDLAIVERVEGDEVL